MLLVPENKPLPRAKAPSFPSAGPQQVEVSLDWTAAIDLPIFYATSFVASPLGPDELVLNIGQVLPPIFTGTQEQQNRQAHGLKTVKVNPVAKILLNPNRIRELIKVLEDAQKMLAALPRTEPSSEAQ
jgi:hypothetical protein